MAKLSPVAIKASAAVAMGMDAEGFLTFYGLDAELPELAREAPPGPVWALIPIGHA